VEEKSLKSVPPVEKLVKCIADEESVFMVYEDLVNRMKSVVVWGSRNIISGSNSDVFENIKSVLKRFSNAEDRSAFRRALLGYVSYDAVRLWEKVKDLKPYSEPWPYTELFEPENMVLYDYVSGKVFLDVVDNAKLSCREKVLEPLKASPYDVMLGGEEFIDAVNRVLEFIRSGYAFQVVLSRFERYTLSGSLTGFYLALRHINPSPYMYFLRFGKRAIAGASPELLFAIRNGVVETYPIAGTRPRSKTLDEDRRLEQELMNSVKDKAEHLMLVDLARNDLGKVCVPGSVRVEKLMYIEKYSHVQHLVSKVVGVLRKRMDFVDVLASLLPAGTVSGAPKPFAMNTIEELEQFKRGPYAGAVGYIESPRKGEMAIAIRSAFLYNDVLRIQAGAGIVYDSKPHLELEETEHKLSALKEALKLAEAR
jgi:anthranilate synthase component 1